MPERHLARPHPRETIMNTIPVRVVRVYMKESKQNKDIVHHLKETAKIRGVTVFRAISGYGDHEQESASIIDFSFHLPIVIEFFDEVDKVNHALEYLNSTIKPEHIIVWDALSNA